VGDRPADAYITHGDGDAGLCLWQRVRRSGLYSNHLIGTLAASLSALTELTTL
jgi:hypothetical protein